MSAQSEGELPDFGHLLDYCATEHGEGRLQHPAAGHLGAHLANRFSGSGLPLTHGLPGGMSVAQLQQSLQQQIQNRGLAGFGLHPGSLPFMPVPRHQQQPIQRRESNEYPRDPTSPGREVAHLSTQAGWAALSQQQQQCQQQSHNVPQSGPVLDGPLQLSQLLRQQQQGLTPSHLHHPLGPRPPSSSAGLAAEPKAAAMAGLGSFPPFQPSAQMADTGSGALSGGSAQLNQPGQSARLASSELDEGRSRLPAGSRHRGDAGAEVTKAKNKLAQRRFRERQRVTFFIASFIDIQMT